MNPGIENTSESKSLPKIALVFYCAKSYNLFFKLKCFEPWWGNLYPFCFSTLEDFQHKLDYFNYWVVETPDSIKIKYRVKTRATIMSRSLDFFKSLPDLLNILNNNFK